VWGCDQNSCPPNDTRSKSTTTQCGNYDLYAGAYHEDNEACGEAIPDSYYLASKPPWFGTLAWPPIDPTVPATGNIPAKVFYDTGSWPDAETDYFTVTASKTGSGTISPEGSEAVASGGDSPTYTATPSTGYRGIWGGTCGATGTFTEAATYQKTNVTADCTITATFALRMYSGCAGCR